MTEAAYDSHFHRYSHEAERSNSASEPKDTPHALADLARCLSARQSETAEKGSDFELLFCVVRAPAKMVIEFATLPLSLPGLANSIGAVTAHVSGRKKLSLPRKGLPPLEILA